MVILKMHGMLSCISHEYKHDQVLIQPIINQLGIQNFAYFMPNCFCQFLHRSILFGVFMGKINHSTARPIFFIIICACCLLLICATENIFYSLHAFAVCICCWLLNSHISFFSRFAAIYIPLFHSTDTHSTYSS